MPRSSCVLRAAAALAGLAAARSAWVDNFTDFDASIWAQATDIEHCTDGACFQARVDHLHYGPGGLVSALTQEPCNTTSSACCAGSKCASWASGKLATVASQAYGTYEARLQPAHRAGSQTPPSNAFSCWTPSYLTSPHNEIAVCFSGSDASSVHFSYWYDATAHTTLLYPGFDFSAEMHDYKVVWAPTYISFFIDGVLAHEVKGTSANLPSKAGYTAIILRPKTTAYIADSCFAVESMSYSEDS